MYLGAFMMPSHPPERGIREGLLWDLDGAIGRCWREYLLPFYLGNGFADHFKVDPSHADSDVTVDYLIEKSWFVGSARTVTEKLEKLQHDTGGFGGLLVMLYDFRDEQGAWEDSLHRLVEDVVPADG